MSFYNMFHGVNPKSNCILKMLNLTLEDLGRFRDVFITNNGNNIEIYTRNGGRNREEYQFIFDQLAEHPNYVCDYDDSFDSTYASIVFNVPEEHKETVKMMIIKETGNEHGDKQ